METNTTQRDITTSIDTTNNELTITFSNGRVITIEPRLLPYEVIRYATLHGLKQKLVDAAAISRDPDTGRTADIEDKFTAVSNVFIRLMEGSWNKPREAGEPRGGLLFAALTRLYPAKSPDTLREWLADKSKKQQAELRTNPKIAKIIDAIRAESATGLDTDELLEELDD